MMMARIPDMKLSTGNTSTSNSKAQDRAKEAAQYIADMLLELRNLSKLHAFQTLQGLLEISYYEAFNETNKVLVPEGEMERLHTMGADARKAFVA
jgi:hypothetical protein